VTTTRSDKTRGSILQRQFPDKEAIRLVPESIARKYTAIPVCVETGTLQIAIANPTDIFALEALASQSRMRVEPHEAPRTEILRAIDLNYKAYDAIERQVSDISLPEEEVTEERNRLTELTDAPVAQALTMIIDEAAKARASDIHFHPQEDELKVRFRVDGILQDILSLPTRMATAMISRMKIMANMNIADHHHTQDGQFTYETQDRAVDVRVGTMPTVCGELAVLRLLDKSRSNLDLSELGFSQDSLDTFRKMLNVPYGMILVSGPTGAGKTTTLYAALNCLNHTEQNIITIEDPVEYRFKNINQTQVNMRAGVSFSTGLRAILRLDPDVILIGEIRDAETAQIAIQGALTGHLVLSSIHANDSLTVVSRLLDLGVEPFLVSSALIGVVAQRMVRQVCTYCGQPVTVPQIEQVAYARETGENRSEFVIGRGCPACSGTGFHGRSGIFELLPVNDELRSMIISNEDTATLRSHAIDNGMVTLVNDGMIKAGKGITTPAEVLRNALSPD
jgi:general secretion pathway protein E